MISGWLDFLNGVPISAAWASILKKKKSSSFRYHFWIQHCNSRVVDLALNQAVKTWRHQYLDPDWCHLWFCFRNKKSGTTLQPCVWTASPKQKSGQNTITPKPELRAFWMDSLTFDHHLGWLLGGEGRYSLPREMPWVFHSEWTEPKKNRHGKFMKLIKQDSTETHKYPIKLVLYSTGWYYVHMYICIYV